jgi:glycosyltransferase involved in cell wall biosynthesis
VHPPSVLIIGLTDPRRDPRVDRQIRALSGFATVTIAAFAPSTHPYVDSIVLDKPTRSATFLARDAASLISRRFALRSKGIVSRSAIETAIAGREFSAILCNDVQALPLAFAVARTAPVVVDLHEFSPRESDESLRWRTLFGKYNDWLCREFLHRASAAITVCAGIAREYERVYGIRPCVLTNAPFSRPVKWHKTDPSRIRMVFHGGATRSRRIESIVDIAPLLDRRFSLDMILVPGDARYIQSLKRRAASMPNVRFLDPVPMGEIIDFTSQYDLALLMLPPTNFNNLHTLPNKFFESLHAQLALAIGPSPEMAAIVRSYDCGVVAPSFDCAELANLLNALSADQIEAMRLRAANAAGEHNGERNAEILRGIVLQSLSS